MLIHSQLVQYVKQENIIDTEHGREARATRLITERASRRIGKMAFETALSRPRKVSSNYEYTYLPYSYLATHEH